VKTGFDAIIVTDVARAQATYEQAVEACGKDRVLVPALLGLRPPKGTEDAA
jgi:broad specificity phosphatase PhoE